MNQKSLFVIVAAALLISACGGQSQPTAQAAGVQEVPTETVMVESVPTEELAMTAEATSSSEMVTYTAPQNLFSLEIPGNWSMERDTATIEKSEIETYTAPDGHAFVQTLVNTTDVEITAVEKGQITLDFMKRLYGSDLTVGTDVSLADGREKLDWWSEMNATSGTTYFDTQDGYLYFATMAYENAYENDYKSVLEDIADSYSE